MKHLSKKDASVISKLLLSGQVVAAPTETAYGLLAEATSSKAVSLLVKIKGREAGKPVALLAASQAMVARYFHLHNLELNLAKKFWPGPLTILLKPKIKFPRAVIGPGGLVGVRVPGSKWLRQLIKITEKPLTATSANLAGRATLYDMESVKEALINRGLKYLVNSQPLPLRPTSTVLKTVKGRIILVRPGAVSLEKLKSMVK